MFNRPPATHNEALARVYARYDAAIGSGDFVPNVYPWAMLGALTCFVYLLVPHYNSPFLKSLRFPVWIFNACCSIYSIFYCRARNAAPAFGVGLISSWSMLWTFTLLVVHDAQTDFARIERTEGASASLRTNGSTHPNGSTHANGSASTNGDAASNASSREKKAPLSTVLTIKDVDLSTERKKLGTTAGPRQRTGTFTWQHFPLSPFAERLDWVADVFCNFRGMGWNWRISGLAPPPRWVQQQLHENAGTPLSDKDTHVGLDGTRRPHTRREALRAAWFTLVTSYLTLDLFKVIVIHDPYFWGFVDAPGPSFLPSFILNSPILLRLFRLLISLNAIKMALTAIFSLAPIFFVGILGPRAIGARGEPWMFPDTFGSFRTVLDKGLAGWWGSWWHQTFRFAFNAPSKLVITCLHLNHRSLPARFLQLLIAFILSGCLHAAGSLTQAGHTTPLPGPFCFFFLQAFGIVGQGLLVQVLKSAGVVQRCPKLVRQLANFVAVHVWFYFTAPLLTDDFARGGLWLFEPVPLSPLRALGFGDADSHWFCWKAREGSDWFRWHSGKHWWESGIAL